MTTRTTRTSMAEREAASLATRANVREEIILCHCPPGVTEVVASSAMCCIGRIDDETVLKYLHKKEKPEIGARETLAVEAQIYNIVGHHPRIISFKGGNADEGLRLEYATNGSVAQYLNDHDASVTVLQKLTWSLQAAEGIAHIHSLSVLHCDINTNNLLLDSALNLKVADFQGQHLAPDGRVLLDGLSRESPRSSMPRSGYDYADKKTDFFALGSAMYDILEGHPPFPELNSLDDDEELEITSRFASGRFPPLSTESTSGATDVVYKCWSGSFESATEIIEDLRKVIEKVQHLEQSE